MKKLVFLNLALMLFIQISRSQAIPDSALYLGQTPPGDIPTQFAPEILQNVCDITFSPNGKQVFFDNIAWPHRVIKHMEYKNDAWTSPSVASFSINQYPGEPFFSPDGNRVYFYAFPNLTNTNNTDIYYSEKQDSVWGTPVNLGGSMVTSVWEFHPCLINDSSLYYTEGNGEICKSQYNSGVYESHVKLPYPINYANTSQVYADAYVNPDENYMIFRSNRTGGFGKFDLYISYKKSDGTWTNPKNLGDKINTSNDEGEGDITPDGKYMTFLSNHDLYWVSTSFIDSLRLINFIPYYMPGTISNQTDTVDHQFSYTIPSQAFIDDDGNNTLSFTAILNDGRALPDWLSFDTTTLTFSGTPVEIEDLSIKVIAQDTAGASCSATFTLTIIAGFSSVLTITDHDIIMYPNPSSGTVTLLFGAKPVDKASIEIYDLMGKRIYYETLKNSSQCVLNLVNNPKGMYVAKLIIDNEVITKTILLE